MRGWTHAKVDDVCIKLIGGGTPSREKSEYFGGDIIWLTPTEIPKNKIIVINDSKEKITRRGLEASSATIVPNGTVLLTSRATIGAVAIAGCEVSTNQGFASFICSEVVNNRYLAYWLWGNKDLLESKAKGTTFKEISKSILKELYLPLPPLNEQNRIASKLEELVTKLNAGIEDLKTTQISLNQYRQSILKYVFEGKLTEEWRQKNNNKVESALLVLQQIGNKKENNNNNYNNYKIDKDLKFPKEWVVTSIEDIARVNSGLTPLRSEKKFYDSGSIPWVKSTSLNNPYVTKGDEYLTAYAIKKTGIHLFPPRTLLVAMLGDGKTRGKVSELLIEATINQACAAIVIDDRYPVVRKYVKLYLQRKYDDIRRLSSGGVQLNLNLTLIRKIKLPFPPLLEQQIIVDYLDEQISVINQIESLIDEQLIKCNMLKKCILENAFTGKLVPQDPNDEPANIILERMKEKKDRDDSKQVRLD